jgi:hypothetical protein
MNLLGSEATVGGFVDFGMSDKVVRPVRINPRGHFPKITHFPFDFSLPSGYCRLIRSTALNSSLIYIDIVIYTPTQK